MDDNESFIDLLGTQCEAPSDHLIHYFHQKRCYDVLKNRSLGIFPKSTNIETSITCIIDIHAW